MNATTTAADCGDLNADWAECAHPVNHSQLRSADTGINFARCVPITLRSREDEGEAGGRRRGEKWNFNQSKRPDK